MKSRMESNMSSPVVIGVDKKRMRPTAPEWLSACRSLTACSSMSPSELGRHRATRDSWSRS